MKHIILTIFILCTGYKTYACDCIIYPIETYIKKVDIIFTGKVIELLDTINADKYIDTPENIQFYKGKAYTVRVLIIERLKTGQNKSDTLEFASDYTNCDPIYKLNESYLFFADKTESEKFKMTHCTYWGTLDESKGNIEKLKANIKN